jgi:hypothetical protein
MVLFVLLFSSTSVVSKPISTPPSLKSICNVIFSYHAKTGEVLDTDFYAKVTMGVPYCKAHEYSGVKDVFEKREVKAKLDKYIADSIEQFKTIKTLRIPSSIAVEHYNFDTKEFIIRVNKSKKKSDNTIIQNYIANAYLLEIVAPKLDIPFKPSSEEEA